MSSPAKTKLPFYLLKLNRGLVKSCKRKTPRTAEFFKFYKMY